MCIRDRSYGRPNARRHVIQVEIDRRLYLDEARVEPLPCFAEVQRVISGVIAEVAGLGRRLPLAAE